MIVGSRNPGIGTLLRQLLAQLDGDVLALYGTLGLPFRPRFYPIFQHLLDHGSASINEIAVAIHASQPAATQTVNELKSLGLVSADLGEDRRQRRIQLTQEGLQLADGLAPVWKAVQRAATHLDDELPSSLTTTLKGALSALERRSFADRINDELSGTET